MVIGMRRSLGFIYFIGAALILSACQTTNISNENVKITPETARLDLSGIVNSAYDHTIWAWADHSVYVESHGFADGGSETRALAGFTAQGIIWVSTNRASDFEDELRSFPFLDDKVVYFGKNHPGKASLGPMLYSFGSVDNRKCAFGLLFFTRSPGDAQSRYRGKLRVVNCNHNNTDYDPGYFQDMFDKVVVRDAYYNGTGVPDPNVVAEQ